VEAAGLARAPDTTPAFLLVIVPVTVRASVRGADAADLIVTAALHAPPGRHIPVALAPFPAVEYADLQQATSGSVTVKPPLAEVRGGVDRSVTRQRKLRDVAGAGSSCLEWLTTGRPKPLAGSHEFRFMVRNDESRLSWVEVTARLRAAPNTRWRRRVAPAQDTGLAPLIADTEPQANATLRLYASTSGDAEPFLIARPLELPLSFTAAGLSVASPGEQTSTVGTLRWFDDVEGRPGYTWLHRSSAAATMDGDPGARIDRDTTVFLPDGAVLRFAPERCLRVGYDLHAQADRTTLSNCLDLQVFVDGQRISTHTTNSDYVTVGRHHRDISINRPDISRSHGVLELGKNGWSYRHKSGACDARLVRNGTVAVQIRRDDAVPVDIGDEVHLTDRVYLLIE
jgi:hypothetical protein